jgi:Pup-ligase protein
VLDLVAHDKAGERILEGLLTDAGRRLRERGIDGDLYLFKNNTDSAGNSYGCHENYLVDRHVDFGRLTTMLTPFLVTRQIICGDPVTGRVLEMWQRVLGAIETGNLDTIAREIDWVTKYQLIERYRTRHDLPLSAPRIAWLDLAYHDLCRDRGLYYQLQRTGAVHRVTRDLDIFEAKSVPPQTTRAKLRGGFIRQAQQRRRDFVVDWVHLKLNDQAQQSVPCKDPFRSVDERVDRLIARM